VRRARLDGHDVARPCHELLVADSEAKPALEHLEALRLVRMRMGRRDEPVRAYDRFDEHGLAAAVAGGSVEDENFAGD
jgi:hypothetical protein